jgi:hypothetical protein
MRRVLVSSPYIVAEEDALHRVVTVTRSAKPAGATGEELLDSYRQLVSQIEPRHKEYGLLIDSRLAPGRSNPEFEQAVGKITSTAQRQFARVVILIASAVGELQVRRLQRERHGREHITRDYDEALALARGAAEHR